MRRHCDTNQLSAADIASNYALQQRQAGAPPSSLFPFRQRAPQSLLENIPMQHIPGVNNFQQYSPTFLGGYDLHSVNEPWPNAHLTNTFNSARNTEMVQQEQNMDITGKEDGFASHRNYKARNSLVSAQEQVARLQEMQNQIASMEEEQANLQWMFQEESKKEALSKTLMQNMNGQQGRGTTLPASSFALFKQPSLSLSHNSHGQMGMQHNVLNASMNMPCGSGGNENGTLCTAANLDKATAGMTYNQMINSQTRKALDRKRKCHWKMKRPMPMSLLRNSMVEKMCVL
jgi:hypothetical protein